MKQLRSFQWIGILLLTAFLIVSLTAWNQTANSNKLVKEDTIPQKGKKITDLDEALKELDKGLSDLDKTISNQNWKEVEKNLQEALRSIDTEKIKVDIEKSIKAIDVDKLKMDIDASLAKVDWAKLKSELESVKKIEFEKMAADLKKLKPELERSLAEAKADIEKAKGELTEYKTFVSDLEKDGLISKKEGYTIVHKDGELIINDKKQPEAVYNKHRSFLEKYKNFTLKKDLDDFNLHVD